MADITKCPGTNCPHKDGCYRFTALADEYQSYFVDAPIEDGRCDMYWGDNGEGIWQQLVDIAKTKD